MNSDPISGDAKYGRLFTEADVERLIAETLIMQHQQSQVRAAAVIATVDAKPGQPPLTFPVDEPLFLLRGQDKAAPHAIDGPRDQWGEDYPPDYRSAALWARNGKVGDAHDTAVVEAARRMFEWQAQNPARVKMPD